MRKVILFISMSLDGYIADRNGGVGWLSGQSDSAGDMDSYGEFIDGIDTVLMGGNTYRQIVNELSPDEWVYKGLKSYVISRCGGENSDEVFFTDESPVKLVEELKPAEGSGIWICGGAAIARQLIKADMIDRYHISIIPTILGGGIRLFGEGGRELKLKLIKTQSYNGITDLVYERR